MTIAVAAVVVTVLLALLFVRRPVALIRRLMLLLSSILIANVAVIRAVGGHIVRVLGPHVVILGVPVSSSHGANGCIVIAGAITALHHIRKGLAMLSLGFQLVLKLVLPGAIRVGILVVA